LPDEKCQVCLIVEKLARQTRSLSRSTRAVVSVAGLAVLAALAALVVALPIGATSAAAFPRSSTATITLYSGQHPQTVDALVAGFTKATGINVAVRSGDEDQLTDQIIEEGTRSPADVVYTENSLPLEALAFRHLLAPVDPATLARVPAKYNSPTGNWVGVSARVSVFVYNTKLIKTSELPSSLLDLSEPSWKGKIGIAPGETDFQPVVEAVLLRYGKARTISFLDGLKSNAESHVYPDNESLVAAVNDGQVAAGVINHYYWYRLRVEVGARNMKSALFYFAPRDPGYVLDISGAAVLASSKHMKAAQAFLAYLVSKKGQEVIANGDSFEYPIGSNVRTSQPIRPFSELQPDPLSIAQLGDGATPVALLQQVGLL
jgi:iron(III) transport system substrate-binding protein